MTAFYLILFLLGLCIGSFLNVLIDRIPKNESISGRSYCPHCKTRLSWYDLIPIFSFLILGRRCRYCKKPISWQYPIVEITTGLLFLLIFNFSTLGGPALGWQFLNFLYYLIISCFLVVIFFSDLKYYIIPDKIIYPAIAVSSIWYFVCSIFFKIYTRYEILNTIYSAFGAALFFLLIVLVSRGKWMGVGDVKFAVFMGLLLGWPNILVALFLAVFLGAIIGLGLIILGKKKLKSEIPFGPFLVTGTFIAMFWGQKIIEWYFDLLTV